MQATIFYKRIVKIATLPPYDRYGLLAELHTEVAMRYINTIRRMAEQEAYQLTNNGRTVSQVVGYIAEWERFTILATGEMIAGVQWPRIMNLAGYLEPNGQSRDFDSVDEFKAYQAAKHAAWSWKETQELAIHTATALIAIFTQPAILSPDILQQTRNYEWRLPNGLKLTIPVGWYLWIVCLEHETITHAAELGW